MITGVAAAGGRQRIPGDRPWVGRCLGLYIGELQDPGPCHGRDAWYQPSDVAVVDGSGLS